MTCDDIKKRLKPFLDDLLVEDEYQLFISHINECPKCKDYISAIGSLSNQLWALGDVTVPADLCQTAIYKFKQRSVGASAARPVNFRNLALGVMIVVLTALAFFFGISYYRIKNRNPEETKSPIVTTTVETGKGKPDDGSSKQLLKELENIASSLKR